MTSYVWVAIHFMFQWLEDTFLPYLKEWEDSVAARPGFTDAQKKRMLLSEETLDGLRVTSKLRI